MARLARVVVPRVPHHVTQRGNRRQATFFNEGDYGAYLDFMAEWRRRCGVAVWVTRERLGRVVRSPRKIPTQMPITMATPKSGDQEPWQTERE